MVGVEIIHKKRKLDTNNDALNCIASNTKVFSRNLSISINNPQSTKYQNHLENKDIKNNNYKIHKMEGNLFDATNN